MVRDPVCDELDRAELDGLGLNYFLDVRATVRAVLADLARPQRTAFAAAAAERLLREHDSRPASRRAAHVTDWRSVLDTVWRGLDRDDAAGAEIAQAVGCFYLSPAYRDCRHDDAADGHDHTVMAAFYAAECFLHGCLEFATWAGWRAFDVATIHAAADVTWPHKRSPDLRPSAWELAHPAIQAELEQQLIDLELVARLGWTLVDDDADRDPLLDELRRGTPAQTPG